MLHALFLRDYRLPVSIGIHPHERAGAQQLRIDIALLVDRAVARDDIADVVDYDFLRHAVAALTAARHFETQEALAGAILALCRDRGDLAGVRVATEKPDIYPDAAGVGCRMLWLRDDVDPARAALLIAD